MFDFEVTAEKRQFAEQTDGFQSCALKTGANGDEVPPVPIPNTEVKLLSADDTWWATAWESKTLPLILFQKKRSGASFCDILSMYEFV